MKAEGTTIEQLEGQHRDLATQIDQLREKRRGIAHTLDQRRAEAAVREKLDKMSPDERAALQVALSARA